MAAQGASSIYYRLFARPSEAMGMLRRGTERSLAPPVVVLAVVSVTVAEVVIGTALWGPYGDPLTGAASFLMLLCLAVVMASLLWTGLALMCHGMARALGGYGRFLDGWTVLGLAVAPAVLAAPIAVLMINSGSRGMYLYAVGIVPILSLWSVSLAVAGFRQIYRLSLLQAIATAVFPPMLLLSGGWTLVFLGVSYVATVFVGIQRMFLGLS